MSDFRDKIISEDRVVLLDGKSMNAHMIISDRFLSAADVLYPQIPSIASEYVDVISITYYSPSPDDIPGKLENAYNAFAYPRPIIMSEFTYHADNKRAWDCCWDSGVSDCIGLLGICTQQEQWHYPEEGHFQPRADKFRRYVNVVINTKAYGNEPNKHRIVTGYNWYRFWDISFDSNLEAGGPENANFSQTWGLVDTKFHNAVRPYLKPYEKLLLEMSQTNADVQTAITGETFWPDAAASGTMVLNQGAPQ